MLLPSAAALAGTAELADAAGGNAGSDAGGNAGGALTQLLRIENEDLREELARERKVNAELREMLGFRERHDGFRVRSLAERDGAECYFWFVRADKIRECKETSLQSFQTLVEKPGWLVLKNITLRGCCDAEYKSKICVVSHRWEQPTEPDREGVQLAAVQQHLAKNLKFELVWFDFWCMPQGARSGGEKLEFDTMLRNVNLLYLGCSVLAILDLSYMSRFWTQFEAWLACQMITDKGLVPAGPTDRRCKVICVRGARDLEEMEQTLFKMWRNRSPQDAYDVLVSPDVTVTNLKDKSAQLPKILTLATQVRCCKLGQRVLRDAEEFARRLSKPSSTTAITKEMAEAEKLLALATEGKRDAEAAELIDEGAFLEASIAQAREILKDAHTTALEAAVPESAIDLSGIAFEVTTEPSHDAKETNAHVGKAYLYKILRAHILPLTNVSFDPSGERVITSSYDRTCKVWSTQSGEELLCLEGHKNVVYSSSFSKPDGRLIASGSFDKTARLWDAQTGECLHTLRGHQSEVVCMEFHPMGTMLVTGGMDTTGILWDVSSGAQLHTLVGHTAEVVSVCFSPSGEHLLTGSFDHTARMWDTHKGGCVLTLQGHGGEISAAKFDASGLHCVTSSIDRTVKIWNVATGEVEATLRGHNDEVLDVAYNAQGSKLVTASADGTARVYNTGRGFSSTSVVCQAILIGHESEISTVAFSPQGNIIITSSSDRTCRVWDAESGDCLQVLEGHTDEVFSAAFSDKGDTIISGSKDNTYRVYKL